MGLTHLGGKTLNEIKMKRGQTGQGYKIQKKYDAKRNLKKLKNKARVDFLTFIIWH